MTFRGPNLKVIALISGGKDSFLSILRCQELGHEIVALVNLYPPRTLPRDEDLNSHLYQTAGHAIIPFYEQALGIPLYRREISGKAARLEREYDASYLLKSQNDQHDETEDLFGLIQEVLQQHPDANAVCSGAILSSYQRTRIEDICLRLKLKSLAYLWQMSFPLPGVSDDASVSEKSAALLDHFATVGLDARIVKVASGGLDESFLWQSLSDSKVRHRIKNAMRRFGGSVIGEGGEFETLILSGPRTLFKGEILVDKDGWQVRRGQGGETWLDVDAEKVHVKQYDVDGTFSKIVEGIEVKIVPAQSVLDNPGSGENSSNNQPKQIEQKIDRRIWDLYYHSVLCGTLLLLSNVHSNTDCKGREQEMQLIMVKVKDMLRKENLLPCNLVSTTMILRNMDDFEKVNAVYKTAFSKPIPPARVTVAAGDQMPTGMFILLSCIAYRDLPSIQDGLHVQSISYWAPANIGPYSQAVRIPIYPEDSGAKVVFIAGQIPLVPETMLLAQYERKNKLEEFEQQAVLALRHARRVGSVMNVCWFGYAIAFISANGTIPAQDRANIAYTVWKNTHEQLEIKKESAEESEALDLWDVRYGSQSSFVPAADEHEFVPRASALRTKQLSVRTPGFLAVHIDRLPRDAQIEWQTAGFSGGTIEIEKEDPYRTTCKLFQDGATASCASATVSVAPSVNHRHSARRHHNPNVLLTIYGSATNLAQFGSPGASVVPCRQVWGPLEEELVELSHGVVEQQLGNVV